MNITRPLLAKKASRWSYKNYKTTRWNTKFTLSCTNHIKRNGHGRCPLKDNVAHTYKKHLYSKPQRFIESQTKWKQLSQLYDSKKKKKRKTKPKCYAQRSEKHGANSEQHGSFAALHISRYSIMLLITLYLGMMNPLSKTDKIISSDWPRLSQPLNYSQVVITLSTINN